MKYRTVINICSKENLYLFVSKVSNRVINNYMC